jgi:hypothetical protein
MWLILHLSRVRKIHLINVHDISPYQYWFNGTNDRLNTLIQLINCSFHSIIQSHNCNSSETDKRYKETPSLTLSSCLNNTQKLQGHHFEPLFTIKHTLKKIDGWSNYHSQQINSPVKFVHYKDKLWNTKIQENKQITKKITLPASKKKTAYWGGTCRTHAIPVPEASQTTNIHYQLPTTINYAGLKNTVWPIRACLERERSPHVQTMGRQQRAASVKSYLWGKCHRC